MYKVKAIFFLLMVTIVTLDGMDSNNSFIVGQLPQEGALVVVAQPNQTVQNVSPVILRYIRAARRPVQKGSSNKSRC